MRSPMKTPALCPSLENSGVCGIIQISMAQGNLWGQWAWQDGMKAKRASLLPRALRGTTIDVRPRKG